MTEQLVVFFELGSEHYAIDSMGVREIIRMQAITKIPGAPESVLGVINLRGKVTPVLDLRKRLGLLANGESQETRIMVVEVEGQYVGLVVDGVSEVSRIPSSAVEPTSTIVAAASGLHTGGGEAGEEAGDTAGHRAAAGGRSEADTARCREE